MTEDAAIRLECDLCDVVILNTPIIGRPGRAEYEAERLLDDHRASYHGVKASVPNEPTMDDGHS